MQHHNEGSQNEMSSWSLNDDVLAELMDAVTERGSNEPPVENLPPIVEPPRISRARRDGTPPPRNRRSEGPRPQTTVSRPPSELATQFTPLILPQVMGRQAADREDAVRFMWVMIAIKMLINTGSNIVVMVGSVHVANDVKKLGFVDEDILIWTTMVIGVFLQLAMARRTRGDQYLDFFAPIHPHEVDALPRDIYHYFPACKRQAIKCIEMNATLGQMVFMAGFGSAWLTNALSILIAAQRFQKGDYCDGVTGGEFTGFLVLLCITVSPVMIAYWLAWRATASLDFVSAVSLWPEKLRNVYKEGVTFLQVFTAMVYLVTLSALGAQTFAFTEFYWDTSLRLLTTDGRNYGGMDGGCAVGDDFDAYVWLTYLCGSIATAGFLMAEMEALRDLIVHRRLSFRSWPSRSLLVCPSCSDISSGTLAVGETVVNTMLPNYYAVLSVLILHECPYNVASALSLFMALLKGSVHLIFNYLKSCSGGVSGNSQHGATGNQQAIEGYGIFGGGQSLAGIPLHENTDEDDESDISHSSEVSELSSDIGVSSV